MPIACARSGSGVYTSLSGPYPDRTALRRKTPRMRTALYVPTHGDYGDPQRLLALAEAAEAAGYDGFFIWDHLVLAPGAALPLTDATVVLGALAQATHHMKLGALITPLSRRRPWKFAKELTTLDQLSGGRVVCGVGLGEPVAVDFAPFGEVTAATTRAERLDEGLQIVDGLLRGQSVTHEGNHYRVENARISPACAQSPRLPIWVGATVASKAGMRRAARWDGYFPIRLPEAGAADPIAATDCRNFWLEASEFGEVVGHVRALREGAETAFEFLASGRTIYGETEAATATLAAYHEAGATWWLEWVKEQPGTFEETLAAVKQGAPRAFPHPALPTVELREAVRQLHAEIDHTRSGDRETLGELRELLARIEHELAKAGTDSNLVQRLEALKAGITRLEFAHPRATAILNDIAMMLGNLGI